MLDDTANYRIKTSTGAGASSAQQARLLTGFMLRPNELSLVQVYDPSIIAFSDDKIAVYVKAATYGGPHELGHRWGKFEILHIYSGPAPTMAEAVNGWLDAKIKVVCEAHARANLDRSEPYAQLVNDTNKKYPEHDPAEFIRNFEIAIKKGSDEMEAILAEAQTRGGVLVTNSDIFGGGSDE